MKTLFRCDITVEEDTLEHLWAMLSLRITFGWEEESLATGETRVRVHCESREFLEELMEEVRRKFPSALVKLDNIENEDWTMAWRQYFTPITCGERFVVLPPWLQNENIEGIDTEGKQLIVIEPKSAFGTGHHATTALCLEVLSELLETGRVVPGMEFLDVGTGSGILSIACCLSGLYGVGIDIDKLSLKNVQENILLNHIVTYNTTEHVGLDIRHGSVDVVVGRSFDVILANVLARPLQDMAQEIGALLKKDGVLIISGILDVQAKDVEAAYAQLEAFAARPPAQIHQKGEWVALVFLET